ncbi:hypothetical protein GCM10022237_42570 [Nocardioides ginsengisoli]
MCQQASRDGGHVGRYGRGMLRLRFRSFDLAWSVVELVVGLCLLWTLYRAAPPALDPTYVALLLAFGLVTLTGAAWVGLAVRRGLRQRRSARLPGQRT